MKLYPAIDILNGKTSRLIQGDYNQSHVYTDTPLEVAKKFSLIKNIGALHIIDLSGAKMAQPVAFPIIQEIKKNTTAKIHTGGGIRTFEHAKMLLEDILDVKEDRIYIGSLPFKDLQTFEKIVHHYKDSIILTVDVWGETIKISGWMENTNLNIYSFIESMVSKYDLHKYLVTQIQKDGMMLGPDFDLYQNLMQRFPNISLIASGGVSSIDDLIQLNKIKDLNGAIVGKAYYDTKITIEDMQKF